MELMIKKLEEWVHKYYDPNVCAYTAERSYGNYDDCFADGAVSGVSWAAYEVGKILGVELEEPQEPEYDY
jgi:hypothetical protein